MRAPARGTARALIYRHLLRGDPSDTAAKIAEELDLPAPSVRRVLAAMRREGSAVKGEDGWYPPERDPREWAARPAPAREPEDGEEEEDEEDDGDGRGIVSPLSSKRPIRTRLGAPDVTWAAATRLWEGCNLAGKYLPSWRMNRPGRTGRPVPIGVMRDADTFSAWAGPGLCEIEVVGVVK